MRRIVIVVIAVAGLAVAGWFLFLQGATVELQWGGGDWPATVRGTGEALERVVHTGHGKPTAADRARARERARWKAYYYAQLRLAEQLGGLRLDAHTTVRDAVLVDRELKAAFSETVHAAAEVPSGSTVEELPGAVRVTVTVEAPAGRVLGLRQAIVRALAGGRISLKTAGRPAASAPDTRAVRQSRAAPGAGESGVVPVEKAPGVRDRTGATARRSTSTARPPRRAAAELRYTGCVLHLPDIPETLVAAPDFYDAAGVYLGSALDLPERTRATGVPIADPGDTARIGEIAGSHPAELEALVTAGNIMVQRKLSPREAELFATAIRHNRVVLVLGKEAS